MSSSPVFTPGRCGPLALLGGVGLVALAAGVGAEQAELVALGGVLNWFAGVAGNQFQSWLGSKLEDPPRGAEEVFRGNDIREILHRGILAVVERRAELIHEREGSVRDAFRDAGPILADYFAESLGDPTRALERLKEFDVPEILADYATREGRVPLLTIELWEALVNKALGSAGLESWEKAELAEALYTGFGEAVWNLFKRDAAVDGQAFAAVEMLHLVRILEKVEALSEDKAPDLTPLVTRIEVLFERADDRYRPHFVRILGGLDQLRCTQKLHTKMLREILQKVSVPKPSSTGHLFTIPKPKPGFVGRENELKELRARVAEGGVVITALKGMGGIGKTELAYMLAEEWAPRFPDARLRLDGQGLLGDKAPRADKLLAQVIQAFHPDEKLPEDQESLRARYQNLLNGRRVLVLLDNAMDAKQAAPLLPPAGCALIVTSRRSFPLAGRPPIDVGRLPEPEAVELLREFFPALGDQDGAELVGLCAGLPLALRIAGTHLMLEASERGSTDVGTYLGKLRSGRLATLDADADDAGEITVDETLRLSVEQLAGEEQLAWQKLGVFASDFDTSAAEAVSGCSEEMLIRFVRRSLLDTFGEDRYKLHDFAAEYARRLISPELEKLMLIHARYYTLVGEIADELYINGRSVDGLALFDRERLHIEAAFVALSHREDECSGRGLIELCDAVAFVRNLRCRPKEQIFWLENQLSAARAIRDRDAEERALGNLGAAYYSFGDVMKAFRYHEECLEIAREVGDRRGEGNALGNLGIACRAMGDVRKAIEYHEQNLEIAREFEDERGEGRALGNLGNAYLSSGDARKAIEYYEPRLEIARKVGDRFGEGATLGNLGSAYLSLRDARKAIEYYEKHLEIACEMGDRRSEGGALGNLGSAYVSLLDGRKAIDYYDQHLEIARQIGDQQGEGSSLVNSALLFDSIGNRNEAVARLEKAVAIFDEIGSPGLERAKAILRKLEP